MPRSIALRAKNLKVAFGGVVAVDDLSITILSGTVMGLVGPNGAGKTTVLNLLSGFYQPDAGQIVLETPERATSLLRLPVEARARLGVGRTFQTPRLFKEIAVWENVAAARAWQPGLAGWLEPFRLPGSVRRQNGARLEALEVLAQFSLHDKASLYPAQLSLGEQRLVEIARAIFGGSRLVLLDEPFAGLSIDESERLSLEVERLRRDGAGVLLVEHNLEAVRTLASSLLVMDQGRELRSGQPVEVFEDPRVIEVFLGPALSA